MASLQQRDLYLKDKARSLNFLNCIEDIASRYPLQFYKDLWFISIYPLSERKTAVQKPLEFEKMRDALIELDYDENSPFLSQFKTLFIACPVPSFHHFSGAENCDYANHVSNTKNAYISFHTTGDCENVYYSISTKINSTSIYNSFMTWINCENIYYSLGIINSYNVFYCKFLKDCDTLWWSNNCIWCKECIFCNDLENQSYCINNTQYTKEEYFLKKDIILKDKELYESRYLNVPMKSHNWNSKDCHGLFITDSQDTINGYYSHFVRNGYNVILWWHEDWLENAYNTILASWGNDYYNVCAIGWDTQYAYNSIWLRKCSNIYYSYFLEWCTFCLWCVGLKNKSFCILNKQYTKEKRYEMVDNIFTNMKKDWSLGNFFDHTMNPFYYNDTLASLFQPLSKEQIDEKGFLYGSQENRFQWVDRSHIIDISQAQYDESIVYKNLSDKEWNLFSIQKWEFDFLKKNNLPLPKTYRLNRMKSHFNNHK